MCLVIVNLNKFFRVKKRRQTYLHTKDYFLTHSPDYNRTLRYGTGSHSGPSAIELHSLMQSGFLLPLLLADLELEQSRQQQGGFLRQDKNHNSISC